MVDKPEKYLTLKRPPLKLTLVVLVIFSLIVGASVSAYSSWKKDDAAAVSSQPPPGNIWIDYPDSMIVAKLKVESATTGFALVPPGFVEVDVTRVEVNNVSKIISIESEMNGSARWRSLLLVENEIGEERAFLLGEDARGLAHVASNGTDREVPAVELWLTPTPKFLTLEIPGHRVSDTAASCTVSWQYDGDAASNTTASNPQIYPPGIVWRARPMEGFTVDFGGDEKCPHLQLSVYHMGLFRLAGAR